MNEETNKQRVLRENLELGVFYHIDNCGYDENPYYNGETLYNDDEQTTLGEEE